RSATSPVLGRGRLPAWGTGWVDSISRAAVLPAVCDDTPTSRTAADGAALSASPPDTAATTAAAPILWMRVICVSAPFTVPPDEWPSAPRAVSPARADR